MIKYLHLQQLKKPNSVHYRVKKKLFAYAAVVSILLALAACSNHATPVKKTEPSPKSSGQIYLYGEIHGVKKILDREYETWCDYYNDKNMRHLFVELPYYTAEYLNLWMQSDNDDILDAIYKDSEGTAGTTPDTKEFYQKIKKNCPETVFHGTDVGHQHETTGLQFLHYLEYNNLEDTEQYTLAQEAIEQGKQFYKEIDGVYRENTMAENFIREYDNLDDESVMGIYGGAHTGLDAMDYFTGSIPCMANQLKEVYGENIHSEDLCWIAKDIDPLRVDTIVINEKEYSASYFGKADLAGFKDFAYREFWRLENAYDDFKDCPKTRDWLPYHDYPMLIKTGEVFVIDYTKTDGSVFREYLRSDGLVREGLPSTEEFIPDIP